MMNKLLKQQTLLLITLMIGLLFSVWPLSAKAQTSQVIQEIDCSVPAKEEAGSDDPGQVRQTVKHLLSNAFTYGSLHHRLQCDPLIVPRDVNGQRTVSVYQTSLNLVNFGVLIILLIIAFANILRIKLDTYAVKKAVPLLVFGVIMANLASPIVRTIVDFSGVLTATFIRWASVEGGTTAFTDKLISAVYQGGVKEIGSILSGLDQGTGGIASFLALVGLTGLAITAAGPFFLALLVGGIFLLLLPALLFLFLGLLFVARIYVLVILTAVSPVAFASLGFEPLKGRLWGWWWNQFLRWTFMAPAAFGLFWLAIRFFDAISPTGKMDLGTYIITLVLIWFATQMPLRMGGTIMARWNDLFVAPVRRALSIPFSATRAYVQQAVPRDISRFGSRYGLNLVRQGREFFGAIEESNKAKEARSLSVRRGQFAGQLVASLGWKRALTSREQFKKDTYRSPEARERAVNEARAFMRELRIDPTIEGEAELQDRFKKDPEFKKRYDALYNQYATNKDRDKVAATILVNGMLGRLYDVNDYAAQTKILNDQGVDTTPLGAMYHRLYETRTGVPTVNPDTVKNDSNREQVYAEAISKRLENVMRSQNKEGQQELLNKIYEQLKIATNEFRNLEEIEKKPELTALASFLLKEARNAPASRVAQDVKTSGIDQMRHQLGLTSAREVFDFNDNEFIREFSPQMEQSLQRAIESDGLDHQAIASLPDEVTTDLQQLVEKPALQYRVKELLRRFIEARLNDRQLQLEPDQINALLKYLSDVKIKVGDESRLPELIQASDLTKPDFRLRPDQIEKILTRLRAYQAMSRTLQSLKESAGAVEGATRDVITGQPTATSP